jgi:hypothetical protein
MILLDVDLRSALWNVVRAHLLARPDALEHVWTSAPIGAVPGTIPDDIAALLESWFSLVEPLDVLAFLQEVHAGLTGLDQISFENACRPLLTERRELTERRAA